MIAYLDKYDTTVEVPDDISDKDLTDVNDNFHSYVDPKPTAPAPESGLPPETTPQWKPNFYESAIKPALESVAFPTKGTAEFAASPEGQAFGGKMIEQGTFGATKAITPEFLSQEYKDHPAFAEAGELAGGVGSLLATGGALRIAGLGVKAAAAGSAAVDAGFAAGERFIPRAIMTGATFGTRTFIAETVKAFEDQGVNLEQFGKDVVKDTAFGAIFGSIGGLENVPASVSSAGALGFISSKMSGGDNREATLHGAIWAAFEVVGSAGKSEALRMEALGHLKESIGDYVADRNPEVPGKAAQRAASEFVDNAVRKAGFDTAEDIAKSGPGNLLEGIEKVNQLIRNAKVPAEAPVEGEPLPKLPGPIEPKTTEPEQPPKTPLDKAIDTVKDLIGIKPEEPPKPIEPTPEEHKEKGLAEIAERLQTFGMKPIEGAAVFDAYGIDKQPTDLIQKPIEDQYVAAYQAIAAQRGIEKGDKFDAETMDQAQKSVDLINGYFSPKSQELNEFAEQHKGLSEQDVAQMAHNRGLLEEPNTDLMKLEIQKAKQEKIINASMAPGATIPAMRSPKVEPPVAEAVAAHLKESANEITNIVNPASAAPLAAQITREQLGKMARSYDMAEFSLEQASKLFNSQPKETNLEFYDRLEHGADQGSKSLNQISSALRKALDTARDEVIALGTGKLENFDENYAPHYYDQGEKEVGQAVQKAAKRPFEGQKSFLKKRTFATLKDAINAGLTPISYNPVDLVLLKVREMQKYVMAHRTIQEYKKNGLAKYVKVGGEYPEGWTKIDDRISTIFKSPMVAVKEAFDQKVMEDLNSVAEGLGVDLDRGMRAKGEGQKLKDAWGLSYSEAPGQAGKIWTKFAGPESALAHELGHQIDNIYGLQEKFLSDKKIDGELTNLANERVPEKSSSKFREYVQQPAEKMAAMVEAYIHAPELLKSTAPTAYAKLDEFLKSEPKLEPLTKIKPGLLMGTNESEVYAGGNVIAGHIYAQPDAARIINNYLSPGLQKSSIYQAYRYAGNTVNQFQLGFSAFHLGFTTLDTSVSKLALGLNELALGHPMRAIKDVLETPIAPITNILRGNALLKAWRGEGQSGVDPILAEIMASAGGRARMDQFYATNAYQQMKHHFQAGNLVRGILHIPLSIIEASSKPILEYIVPRQKLGVFADIVQMELNHRPDITHQELRAIAQKAWDSVDNRMGQMVYDNLFWDRTFKDLLMGTMRSTGWNIGTAREIGGGSIDAVEQLIRGIKGNKPELTYRTSYSISLPMLLGVLGAMTTYLFTGKGPRELKDYYFPRTGGTDANGNPKRVSFPSYMKDLYHWSRNPVKVATDKLNPILSIIGDMLQNKDYFGTKIRNEDDPVVKQVASEVKFILKQVQPFSYRNMQKNLETNNKSLFDTVGPWVGITPAPYDINQTKAERAAHEIAASHQEIGGRTQEQAERSKLVNDLTRQYRQSDPKATDNLYKAYQSGLISHRQMQEVVTNAHLTHLQKMAKNFTLPEIERVYSKSTDEEKAQLEHILRRKEALHESQFVAP